MGAKNQYQPVINWQSASPITGFIPINPETKNGSVPSGTLAGAMASTNVIYSNIIEKSRMDNINLEITWTGTPTGLIEVLVSDSGINFYPLTFSPILTQPAGSAGGYTINLTQLSAKYIMLRYTNSSGTGTITIYSQFMDLN